MAGPLSSEEIEDVVSSVRRLVSNEQRIKTRDLNAEKLVLTSAYRVLPETSPLSALSPTLSPLMLDAPLVEPAAEHPPEPETQMVEDVAAVEAVDPVASLEDSLARALEVEADLSAESDRHHAAADAPTVEMVEAEWEDEIWAEPDQISLGEAALAAEEAEVLMAPEPEPDVIQAAAPDPDEAGAPDEASSAWADEPIPFVPLRRRAEDLAARVAQGAVVESPDSAAVPDSADPDPANAEPVADGGDAAPDDLEPVLAENPEPAPDSLEPLVEGPDPVAAELAPEPAVAETTPEPVAPVAPADQPHVATGFYDTDGTPLAVLDEAALNEIVRQVLRAELQGELGERITRSVRKLVRAEINRALMARDLD